MDVMEIVHQINSAFFEEGLDVGGYTVKCESPLTTTLYSGNGAVHLIFSGNRPLLSIVKIITFSVELEELYIDADGKGKIKLKNFPDINFQIDNKKERIFGTPSKSSQYEVLSTNTSLYNEIEGKFEDRESRRLAKKALEYAQSWAMVAVNGGTDFAGASSADVRRMKKEAYNFTKQQMESEISGSIIAVLLINLILPYIIKWVVERVIDNLING
jgi:hypothetical protein